MIHRILTGYPKLDLVLCLLLAWVTIFAVISKGVKSSGKAAWFMSIFPYVIMFMLLIRAVTLDGAIDGIGYFLTPQWHALLNPTVKTFQYKICRNNES